MAFTINWTPLLQSSHDSSLYTTLRNLLDDALNRSFPSSPLPESWSISNLFTSAPTPPQLPPTITTPTTLLTDKITVSDLSLGTIAPSLEVLDITDLDDNRFRGRFRISYDGDAEITLKTKLQINPLFYGGDLGEGGLLSLSPPPLPVAAKPLSIPVTLTISELKLKGEVGVVMSRHPGKREGRKGVVVVFKGDPVRSVLVRSSVDGAIEGLGEVLQKEIEGRVRGLFEDLVPKAVWGLSLWGEGEESAHSEMGLGIEMGGDAIEEEEEATISSIPSTISSTMDTHHLGLETLKNSYHTLSLFAPPMRDILYRAKPRASSPAPTIASSFASISSISPSIYDHFDPTFHLSPASDCGSTSSFGDSSCPSESGSAGHPRRRKRRVVDLRVKTGRKSSSKPELCPAAATSPPSPPPLSIAAGSLDSCRQPLPRPNHRQPQQQRYSPLPSPQPDNRSGNDWLRRPGPRAQEQLDAFYPPPPPPSVSVASQRSAAPPYAANPVTLVRNDNGRPSPSPTISPSPPHFPETPSSSSSYDAKLRKLRDHPSVSQLPKFVCDDEDDEVKSLFGSGRRKSRRDGILEKMRMLGVLKMTKAVENGEEEGEVVDEGEKVRREWERRWDMGADVAVDE